jgi:methyl-accepting chemotaxis protein
MDFAKRGKRMPAELNLAAVQEVETSIRDLVREKTSQGESSPPKPCSDVLKAGAESITEITKLIEQLHAARNYLETQGQRIARMADQYSQLTQTASDSVKIISESMGKWRDPGLTIIAKDWPAGVGEE